jgi:hypothetical protein
MIRLSVTLDDIGYAELLEKLASSGAAQSDTELGYLAAGLLKYGRSSVELLPDSTKESLAVKAINQNQKQLCAGAQRALDQANLPARVVSLTAERTEPR